MAPPQRKRNFMLLAVLIVLAAVYAAIDYAHISLTGANRADGIIGALLGLYICSQGAANILDMLLFGGAAGVQGLTRRALLSWIGLNMVILFVGWYVIVLGTTRFTLPF